MQFLVYLLVMLLVMLLLPYGLYRWKSAMGISLSTRYHAKDLVKLLLRAGVDPQVRRSLGRYLQLNRHNPTPALLRRKSRSVLDQLRQKRYQRAQTFKSKR